MWLSSLWKTKQAFQSFASSQLVYQLWTSTSVNQPSCLETTPSPGCSPGPYRSLRTFRKIHWIASSHNIFVCLFAVTLTSTIGNTQLENFHQQETSSDIHQWEQQMPTMLAFVCVVWGGVQTPFTHATSFCVALRRLFRTGPIVYSPELCLGRFLFNLPKLVNFALYCVN